MTNARAVSNTTQACVTNVKNVPCFLTCVKLATYSYSFYWNWRYYQIRSAAKWSFTSPRHIITADNGTVPSDDIKDCCVVVILCKFDFGLGGGQTIVLPPPETSWGGAWPGWPPPPLDPPLAISIMQCILCRNIVLNSCLIFLKGSTL